MSAIVDTGQPPSSSQESSPISSSSSSSSDSFRSILTPLRNDPFSPFAYDSSLSPATLTDPLNSPTSPCGRPVEDGGIGPATHLFASLKHRRRAAPRWILVLVCVAATLYLWRAPRRGNALDGGGELDAELQALVDMHDSPLRLRPVGVLSSGDDPTAPDPQAWLAENSDYAFAVGSGTAVGHSSVGRDHRKDPRKKWFSSSSSPFSPRPRAAIISLVRNEELEGIMQSMRQLEFHWNDNYRYPWIFFNEKPFSDEFKAATSNLTQAECFYELIPAAHWSTPEWIDMDRYMNSLDYLGTIGVGKGWMLSYRNMCRWNSGFFYKHPRLLEYDYYWRVEPDVHFFCNIDYDVFRFMRDNALQYGFTMNILDDARSFPSLFPQTLDFIAAHPEHMHASADLGWLLDDNDSDDSGGGGGAASSSYNNCQFFSNFEVGSLGFFRSAAHEAYFAWLDARGGFFYERFGDAPIHTLAAALFLAPREIWWFRDVGYQHDAARHCPPASAARCACEPTRLDENFYKLVPMESPQRKPRDTCLRAWLGGAWTEKKKGWSAIAERAFGGDGYGGYVRDGMD